VARYDVKVRQAIAYATDRQAVVDSIVHLNNPSGTVQNCGMVWFPGVGPWCPSGPGPFAQFTYDPQKAMQILTSDGYDCSKVASGGFCQKGGKDLTIQYNSVAGNARRETTEALLKEKAKAAGINYVIKNFEATDLFSNHLPKLTYGMAEFANGGVIDPSVTSIFACENIPSAKNSFGGQNTDAWCNKQATDLMHQSDQELDPAKRAQLIQQIGQLQAQDMPALPLYVLPNVFAWRKDALAGPLGQYVSSVYGPFFNMDLWYQAS
jgi:peptide/nickel transport system substrate-binding protein